MEKLRQKWKETTGKSFDDLNPKAATAIASVAFQHGDLSRKAPNFWKQVTNEDWSGAFFNLLDWDSTGKPSQTQTRREKEAKLLEGLFKGR
jgi:GH24 family phage-related lysozyme (muramidase)